MLVPRDLSDEEYLERERTRALLEQLWRSNPRIAELTDKELMRQLTNLKLRGDTGDDGRGGP
jgi:hypothetical protein